MANITTSQIRTELKHQKLQFETSGEPTTFEFTVHNEGMTFASFYPTLRAHGAEDTVGADWYRLAPSVSAKLPPGDSMTFVAEIFALPDKFQGSVNNMRLLLKVHSPELQQYDSKDLTLLVKGTGLQSPQLTLTAPELIEAKPKARLSLDLTAFNPNRKSLVSTFTVVGLPGGWVLDGERQNINLNANQACPLSFTLQLPDLYQAPSGDYPITIYAEQVGAPEVAIRTMLRVLAEGDSSFSIADSASAEQQLPNPAYRWLNPRQSTATYHLTLRNHSNQAFQGRLLLHQPQQEKAIQRQARSKLRRWPWSKQATEASPDISQPASAEPLLTDNGLASAADQSLPAPVPAIAEVQSQPSVGQLTPDPNFETLPDVIDVDAGATVPIQLKVHRRLPWFGWSRLEELEAQAILVDDGPEIQEDRQPLRLQVLPVIPLWLQLASGTLLLTLCFVLWGLQALQGHRRPVTAVEFDGQARELISASQDQTLRRWPIKGGRLKRSKVLRKMDSGKALLQARYRPFNNNEIAMALENGEVEILNLMSGEMIQLIGNRADRALDVVFTRDAHTVFVGHGSGLIRQWNLTEASSDLTESPFSVEQDFEVDFAIYALTLAGADDRYLLIAGRNNQLAVLDRASQQLTLLPYSSGGSEHYINSLATADEKPYILAVGDNQGYLSIWNLRCLEQGGICQPLVEPWNTGHNKEAIQTVALSPQACFLASVGDDGQTKLWPLSNSQRLLLNEERSLVRSRKPQTAVDLVRIRNHLLIASGGNDKRVRLKRLRFKRNSQNRSSSDRCPELR